MKRRILPTLLMILLLVFALAVPGTAEESFDASTMRLLRFDGDVQILDLTGIPRFVMENVRFASGETMITGEGASASVGLDDDKIVTLDESTKVEFIQEEQHMLLNLLEGQIFIDVQEKLDENASFDIQTTTMTVGIRGTLLFAQQTPPNLAGVPAVTTFGIMEGSGTVDTTDSSGSHRIFTVTPGQILTATDPGDGTGVSFSMDKMTAADTEGFVQKVVNDDERLRDRVLEAIPDGLTLLAPPSGGESGGNTFNNPHPANKNWIWSDPVQLTAQSASKLYDGQPLSRTSGALVSGLPEDCSIEVTCEGEITDAGTAENVISSYKILNNQGEDVTAHFSNIVKVAGTLKVDRAPLTIWTGKAEKVYDGEPLTCADAGIRTVSGYTIEDPEWRNTSVVSRSNIGTESMIGVAGSVWVHGSNPVTGDSRDVELPAGKRLVVSLTDENGNDGLTFSVEPIAVQDLPEEVLRLYAENPGLLEQALEDVEWWDAADLQARIDQLDASGTSTVRHNGLTVPEGSEGDIMTDSSNLRITMDSDVTTYTTQVITGSVARFVPITLDPSITVTAVGEQLEVGESDNDYEILWGDAKESNYDVTEDLGKLKVTPLQVEINCGGYTTTYDGKAFIPWPTLKYLNGPHAGEQVNSSRITGALPARAISDSHLRAASHTYHFVLFTGDTIDLVISGFGTKPGVYTLTGSVTSSSPNLGDLRLSLAGTRVTIQPATLVISTGSAVKEYDGEPLTCADVTVTGLAAGDSVTVKATGTQTEAGVSANTYEIDWGDTDPNCYKIEENLGTLTVTKATNTPTPTPTATPTPTPTPTPTAAPVSLVFDLGGGTFEYYSDFNIEPSLTVDGTAVDANYVETDDGPYVAGFTLPDGNTVTLEVSTGFTYDSSVGTYVMTGTATFAEEGDYAVSYTNTSITITPMVLDVYSPDHTKTYDGYPYPMCTDDLSDYPELLQAWALGTEYTEEEIQVDVGTYSNTIEYEFHMETGRENYDVQLHPGTITIEKCPITLTSEGGSKTYDGTALTKPDVTVGGSFAEGEVMGVTATGSVTNVDDGQVTNTITIQKGDTYKDSNYTITKNEGKLQITPRSVTLTSSDGSKTYDGTPLTKPIVTEGGDGFVEGEVSGITATGAVTNVSQGQVTNTIVFQTGGSYRDSNYSVTKTEGKLSVTKAPLTVTTGSASRVYNGEPLIALDATLTGLVDGESAEVDATGTATHVKDSGPNTYSITWGSTDENNYQITENLGTLTVSELSFTTEGTRHSHSGTYELEVTCDKPFTQVPDGESAWILTWEWGDKISVYFKDDLNLGLAYDFADLNDFYWDYLGVITVAD